MAGDIRSYRDLKVWQRTKKFAVQIYSATEQFPSKEMYGLTNQMRRAAVSMPSNIAEGFRRSSRKEQLQFMRIAYGSGAELETQIEISQELLYLEVEIGEALLTELGEIMRMINTALRNMNNPA